MNAVRQDHFSYIKQFPQAENIKLGMQYFIPEWDDRVDSRYDFIDDKYTLHRDPYEDKYAHEIYYPEKSYDGILISRTVIDKSKKKKVYVEQNGIRKLLRYSGLLMGDCGAFSYIAEEKPPYTTEEVFKYYISNQFDYGVSIDHLIVGDFAKPGVREFRYDLTLTNAEHFLTMYWERGNENFTPIGVAQGWDADSYTKAVKELIIMGYDYIALGGLARAPTTEILEILIAVSPYLTPQTRMHLFGVARSNALQSFRHLGVTSFDSSSPLRSAWLDPNLNYLTNTGESYIAIRVPPVSKHGGRVKLLIEAKVASREELYQLEQNSLSALREFDKGQRTLHETIKILMAYERLLELPRNGKFNQAAAERRAKKHEILYTKLLEDKPWKKCSCVICQQIGIEVVIFRGNNRNRRRGFHNTYTFYKQLQSLLDS